MNLIPLEDRVIILQDEGKKETTGGIFIPETSVQKPAKGTIVAIGPGKSATDKPIGYLLNDVFLQSLDGKEISRDDRVVPIYAKPFLKEDKVYFARFAGTPVEDGGKEYLCMRFSDVISRI